jgi:hypothetical protein
LIRYSGQKFIRTSPRLFSTQPSGTEYDPPDLQIRNSSSQLEQCAPGADLDIIRVRAKAQYSTH